MSIGGMGFFSIFNMKMQDEHNTMNEPWTFISHRLPTWKFGGVNDKWKCIWISFPKRKRFPYVASLLVSLWNQEFPIVGFVWCRLTAHHANDIYLRQGDLSPTHNHNHNHTYDELMIDEWMNQIVSTEIKKTHNLESRSEMTLHQNSFGNEKKKKPINIEFMTSTSA